jgi:crossover junction endodeoxyribonuclease RuvC
MTVFLGVDPGVSGAIAFYFPPQDRVSVYDVPIAGGEIATPVLADIIIAYGHYDMVAWIERVGAMPGNGGASMFNFGRAYGDVRGVIGALKIPTHFVTPQMWKKHFRLTSDKDQSRALAIRLFPDVADNFKRKKDDGRAEAALIALYGARQLQNQNSTGELA